MKFRMVSWLFFFQAIFKHNQLYIILQSKVSHILESMNTWGFWIIYSAWQILFDTNIVIFERTKNNPTQRQILTFKGR